MTTGEKIRVRRQQLGLTVDDLAAKLGKNRATIYRYESDAIEMPASLLKPLAEALDTTPDDLMDWDTLLASESEHREMVREVLPRITDGISIEGGGQKYVLFKAPARSGEIECDLQAALLSLYQLNLSNQSTKLRTIRILSELVSSFDPKTQEHLLSYAEFLDARKQNQLGLHVTHPYQRE